MLTERPAKGVRGYVMFNPVSNSYWFREYDPKDRRQYKDYPICVEDLEVEILSTRASIYDSDSKFEGSRIGWSGKKHARKAEQKPKVCWRDWLVIAANLAFAAGMVALIFYCCFRRG